MGGWAGWLGWAGTAGEGAGQVQQWKMCPPIGVKFEAAVDKGLGSLTLQVLVAHEIGRAHV